MRTHLFMRCSKISLEGEFFIEGDFIEDTYGIIFDVKGYEHPPAKVVAYPRYVPSPSGNRCRNGRCYEKIYDLNVRYEFLRSKLMEYLVYDDVFDAYVCEVPLKNITKHYIPTKYLRNLFKHSDSLKGLKKRALDLALTLARESDVNIENLGISGSLLVNLHRENSDIDLIIYGTGESRKVANILNKLFSRGVLRKHNIEEYRKLFEFRKAYKIMDFETFVKHERRKIFQGFFLNREFFIRFVKKPHETTKYGEFKYKDMGEITIKAKVVDDSESIFTPVSYKIEVIKVIDSSKLKGNVDFNEVREVVSFRGRFCQQVFSGEIAIVKGKLESVLYCGEFSHYRIIVGGSHNDFIISEGLLR